MTFATTQFKKFSQAAITTSLTTNYTVPASVQDVIKDITIPNTTGSAVTVTVHIVPSGGAASAATQIISAKSIANGDFLHWTGTQVMNTGDFIQTIASSTGCTLNASGFENS